MATPEPEGPTSEAPSDAAFTARGWLGVELATSSEGGVVVRSVVRGSAAEHAGIAPGDRIVRFEGVAVTTPEDVVRLVGARAPGTRVGVGLVREGAERLMAAELGAAPDESGVMKMRFVGAPAPAFEALDVVQGSLVPTLKALQGKVVVLEFWATWCVACRFMVPKLNEWHERRAAEGVAVLGVTMEPVVSVSEAARQLGIEYAVASDHSGKTTTRYHANALPTLFVIDARGVVRDVMVGYSAKRLAELESLVSALVREP